MTSVLLDATETSAQAARERTMKEIEIEAQARVERGGYPLIGLDPADVREALSKIETSDRDAWARGWSSVADRYYQAASAATSSDERRKNYLRAWRLYYLAQWPVAASEGKKGRLHPSSRCIRAEQRISGSAVGGCPYSL
jgi:hypothetical protein